MGGSYGGYMTLAAITLYPELFAAAVNTVGSLIGKLLNNPSVPRRRAKSNLRVSQDIEFLRKSRRSQRDQIKRRSLSFTAKTLGVA